MRTILSVLAVLAAAAPAAAQDETVGARWREWFVNINGRIQGQGELVPSSDINLTETLGLDDQENGHEIQLYVQLPVLGRIYAGYWWVDFDGTETLERDITFGDVTFTASTTVDTTLELDMYYLTYEFMFPGIPLGGDTVRLDVGVQVGVRALLLDASIDSALLVAEDDGAVGTPIIGARGALQVTPFLRAELELAGMTIRYGDSSMKYVEAFGEIVGQLGPVFAGVGYKYCSLDFDDESGDVDLEAEVRLDGVYLTAGVRF
jgi:hypothetical protein